MVKQTETAERALQHRIQTQLTQAAHTFAQEILRILRQTTLSELTALAGRQPVGAGADAERALAPGPAAAPLPAAKPAKRKKPTPRTSTLRRIAGTKPVECPVQGCKSPGVRSKMNFCHEHARTLSKAERMKLRQQQRASHVPESIDLPDKKK
jgi:hypothetical protein